MIPLNAMSEQQYRKLLRYVKREKFKEPDLYIWKMRMCGRIECIGPCKGCLYDRTDMRPKTWEGDMK